MNLEPSALRSGLGKCQKCSAALSQTVRKAGWLTSPVEAVAVAVYSVWQFFKSDMIKYLYASFSKNWGLFRTGIHFYSPFRLRSGQSSPEPCCVGLTLQMFCVCHIDWIERRLGSGVVPLASSHTCCAWGRFPSWKS